MNTRIRRELGIILEAVNRLRSGVETAHPGLDATGADRLTAALLVEDGMPVSIADHLGFGFGLSGMQPLGRREATDLACTELEWRKER